MTNLITGQRLHNFQPIPTNSIVFTRNNRECYVSGLSHNNVRLRYLDDGSFEDLGWNEGSLYLPCCVIPDPLKDLNKIKPKTKKEIREENQLKSRI